jgi:hypothetical protein
MWVCLSVCVCACVRVCVSVCDTAVCVRFDWVVCGVRRWFEGRVLYLTLAKYISLSVLFSFCHQWKS